MERDFVKSQQKLIGDGEEVNFDKKLVDVNPIVHGGSEVAFLACVCVCVWEGGGW